jgi:hypothetical protein
VKVAYSGGNHTNNQSINLSINQAMKLLLLPVEQESELMLYRLTTVYHEVFEDDFE